MRVVDCNCPDLGDKRSSTSAVYIRLIRCICPPHQLCITASSAVYDRLISCVCSPNQLFLSASSAVYVRLFTYVCPPLKPSFDHVNQALEFIFPSMLLWKNSHLTIWDACSEMKRKSFTSVTFVITYFNSELCIKQKYFNWIKISHLPHGSASQCLESIYLHGYIVFFFLGSLP